MSNLLGVIKAVIGQVYVVEADGSQRLLKEGDRIYSGEEIVTGASGAVSVELPDGKTMDLGRNSHWSEHGLNAVSTAEHDTQDVASLQKAIADGADPTQALEATAAGNEAPVQIEGGGGGHTLVQLDLTGEIIDPTAGFNTAGIGAPTWEINLPENGLADAGSPPILPPQVQIDNFAGNDGYINKNEINHTNITGSSNQNHVTLTFTDSQKNTITIDVPVNNGHWTANPDLSGLVEGEITVLATATDVSGRTAESTADSVIDVTDLHDQITIDNVTPDNVININESHQPQTSVHGTVSGDAKIGDAITLTVDGKEYHDVVIDLGNGSLGYQINVSTQGLLADPNIHATVTSTDEAGNTTQASSDHHVDIDLDVHNTVTIGTVAGDDVVNASESRMPTMIGGVAGGDAQAGDPVTVTVNGRDYHGVVVSENGQLRYNVPVPTNQLNEGKNDVKVEVVSHDAAGNEAIAVEHHNVTLDTQAQNALTIETVAGDDTVNRTESRMPTFISGEVTGDAQVGDHVVVSVNGQSFNGEVVADENGKLRYTVPVPTSALSEGSNDVQVMVTGVDNVGNTAIAVEHKTVVLDTQSHNALTIETVAGDNTVNASESRMPTLISGEVSGDAHAGDHVVVSVNGQNFYGTVTDENGQLRYEVPVPTAALNEGSNDVQVMITGTDNAGNATTAVEHKSVVLDTHAENHAIIQTVAGDNVVNAAESRMPTLISGVVSGDAQVGDHVVVSVNGHEYRGDVVADANGQLRYEVPVPTAALNEGNNDVQVMVTSLDASGNTAIAVEHKTVVLDTQAHNAVTISPVESDDVVNHIESQRDTFITGHVRGEDAQPGDRVIVHVQGNDFVGEVTADAQGRLHYRIPVPVGTLHEGDNDVQVTVVSHDPVGNEAIAVEHKNVTLDTHADATITLNDVTEDNILNHTELATPMQLVSGVVGLDARVGDPISLNVNGKHFSGHVIDLGNGTLGYQIPVDSSAFSNNIGEVDASVKVKATVKAHDAAGNEVIQTTEHTVHVDNHANTVVGIDTVGDDHVGNEDVLNHTALAKPTQTLTGEVTGDVHVNDKVLVTVGEHPAHQTTVVDLGGGKLGYRIEVDSKEFATNGHEVDRDVKVKVSVDSHDEHGNTVTTTSEHTVHVDNHANTVVGIDTVGDDHVGKEDVLNHDALAKPTQTLTGEVTGDAHLNDKVLVTVGENAAHQATVVDLGGGKLGYRIEVDSKEFATNGHEVDRDVKVKVSVDSHDEHGNTVTTTSEHTVHVDNHANTVVGIDTVGDDHVGNEDVLNHTALAKPTQTLTGEVTGDVHVNDKVLVTVGEHPAHQATVIDLGGGKLGYRIEVDSKEFATNGHEVDRDVKVKVSVDSHDEHGNTVTTTSEHTVHVDNHANTVVGIDTVGDDHVGNEDVLNHTALAKPTQTLTGEVTGDVHLNDKVLVTVGENVAHQATVIDLGGGKLGYRIEVDSKEFATNGHEVDRDVKVKVSVDSHDEHGNTVTTTSEHTVHVDNHANTVVGIDTVGDDHVGKEDVLNHTALAKPTQTLTGEVTGDVHLNDKVLVTVGENVAHQATVIDLGGGKLGYRIEVDSKEFATNGHEVDRDVKVKVSVDSHDEHGNTVTTTSEHTVHVDNHANTVVGIDTVGDDHVGNEDVLNHTALAKPTQTLTGEVTGDAHVNDKVLVTVGEHPAHQATVIDLGGGKLGYRIEVDSKEFATNGHEVDRDVKVKVSVDSHDEHGNTVTTTSEHTVHVDNHANTVVGINTVGDDHVGKEDVLNHDALAKPTQTLTGEVTGDAHLNDKVLVTVGENAAHQATVIDLGGGKLGYRIEVDSKEFATNGHEVDRDVKVKVSVDSHDEHGNTVTTTSEHTVHVDNHANTVVGINTVGDDHVGNEDVLNHDALAKPTQTLTGEVTGDAHLNDKVLVTVGENAAHQATVIDLGGGKLGYRIEVDSKEFATNGHEVDRDVKVKVSVDSHDEHGNTVTTTSEHTVHVDNHANTVVGIDTVGDDHVGKEDVLNHDALAKPTQTLTGEVTGDAHVNDKVLVTVGENAAHQATVIDLGGGKLGYRIEVDSKEFATNGHEVDRDVKVKVSVDSHDEHGNTVTTTSEHTVHVDNHANATITVDSVTDDNTLNHTELEHQTQTITGTVGGDAKPNDEVILTINGNQHKGSVVETPDGHLVYSIEVPTSEFGNNLSEVNADKPFTVQVTSHDKANNEVVVTTEHRTHLDNHAENSVIIKTVAGDNVVNHDEHQHDTDITGQVSGKDAKPGDVVEVTVHGNSYFGTVFEGTGGRLLYNVPVPRDVLLEGKNDVQVKVSSYDKAGNEALAIEHQNVEVDTAAHASITIENITKDNVLNHSELDDNQQWIHGKVGLDARPGDVIDIQIGTQHVYGVVETFADNSLGYRIPVDPSLFSDNQGEQDRSVTFHVSVTSHDHAGNVVTVTEQHTVGIDNFAKATIDIKDVTDQNVLNHSELNNAVQTITGEVHGDAREGDKVTLDVDGHPYFGRVVQIGPNQLGYRIDVKSSDFSINDKEVDKDVKITVKVDSHDIHGNPVTAHYEHTVSVDNHANATLTIEDVTKDNLLNHSELAQDHQIISGVAGGDAAPGDHVIVTVNGVDYPGTVGNDMSYHIPVPSAQFNDNKHHVDGDLKFTAKITSHDAAGNEVIVTAEHTVHIDNFAVNDFTIETVSGEDWVSEIESRSNTIIRGAVTGDDAKPGDIVKVTVSNIDANGKPAHHDYSGTVHVDSNGNLFYSVPVPPGGLYEGLDTVTVQVTSKDLHGNSITTTHTHDIAVDTKAEASIHIDKVTVDDVLNYDELTPPKVTITGVVDGDAKVGDHVVIEVNTYKYDGQVVDLGNGHLGFRIPVDNYAISDNQGKIDTDVIFKASVTSFDELHNKITATTEHTAHIDNHADGIITVGQVSGDNIINHNESREHSTRVTGTVSGTTSGEINKGDRVTITVNHHTYETTVVELPNQHGALGYSVDVLTKDLLADPNPVAHVVAHDASGNADPFELTHHIDIDLEATATITIDPVTGDNMINGLESDNEQTTVSGTVGGDVKEGDVVHLVINHNELTTVVTKDGQGHLVWSKQVSTHDLMVNPDFTATVTATDNANNTATANASDHIVVDLNAIAKITVDSVTPDNALNADELKQGHTLVSGSVDGEMHAGDPLTLTINGKDYHGFVEDQGNGKMGYHISVSTEDLQANPHIHASISVTDQAQNSTVATANHDVIIDDHANATLTINVVSGDDILNHLDQKHPTTTINGTVGGDVHKGDIVHVWVNGIDYPATVEPQPHLNNALGYSVEVRTDALLANPYIHATVTAHDPHGNSISIYASHEVSRDDGAHATISINTVSGDDWINNVDAHQDHTTITGKVTGDVHIGDTVDLEVNNQHYTGKVVSEGKGHGLGYSIDVSTDDLLSGGDKPIIHASITGYDEAGNTVQATTQHSVGIDTRADAQIEVRLDTAGDYLIVTGHVEGDVHVGDTVTITAGGHSYSAAVQSYTNEYSGDTYLFYRADTNIGSVKDAVTGLDTRILRADKNEYVTVRVTGTDQYGNTATATGHEFAPGLNDSSPQTPYTDPSNVAHHPHAEITISPIAGNDVINKAESEKTTTTIRGTVEGDVKAGEFVTLHIGDQDIPVKIVDRPNLPGELGYEVEVDTKYLMAHPDVSVTVTAHNDSGEKVHFDAQKTVQIDTHATAEIHLDNIAGDNVINIAEAGAGTTTISGRVTGDGVHDGSNVTIMVNGNPVTTQVFTDSKGVMRFSKDISVDDLRHTPTITVSVTGQDDQGNPFTATDDKTITVDTDISAHITIDTVAGDNIINLDESKDPITQITGKVSGDVKPGDHVSLTVNGHEYQDVEVAPDSSYKVDVLTSDLVNGKPIAVQVTGHDEHGNTLVAHATHSITVDTDAHAGIKVNTVSGDNILSAKDLGAGKTEISGTVDGDAAPGDKVTVTLHGVQETADVVVDSLTGKLVYKLEVDTNNLKAELESQNTDKPEIVVTVSGEDDAGNHFSQDVHKGITIDDHANVVLTLDKVAVDNILNIDESNQPTTQISGTVTGDVKDGGTIILTVNGNERPVTLHGDPAHGYTFKLDVSTSDLLTYQTITYKVIGVDGVGNTLTVTDTNTITIDHDVKNEVHIGTVAVDDKVNIAEHSDPTTMITGTVDGDAQDGDVVTLMLNGKPVGTYTLQGGLKTFDIPVDNKELTEGDNKIDVSFTGHDTSGNVYTSTDIHTITLDTTIDAHITLDPVAANDVINAAAADHVIITGTITTDSDARPGDKVTVEINHKTFTGDVKVYSDGHVGYDISVDRKYLQEGDNDIKVSVDAKDAAGNTITVDAGHHVLMDTQVRAAIHLDNVAGNNVINAKEVDHVSVTGTIDRDTDAQLGDHVTVTINHQSFTGVVSVINGHLGYDIHVDKGYLHEGKNTFDVSVSATDKAGNAITVHDSHDVQVDTQLDANITLDPVAANNVVNAAAIDHVSVTGMVGTDADAHVGDKVTVTVNGTEFKGDVIDVDGKGQLGYDIHVDRALLHENDNTIKVSVDAKDAAGNTITVDEEHIVHVDTQLDATITLDPVATNNVVNAAAIDHVSVTGMVGTDADAHVGDKVTVTVNGTEFKGDVVDVDGKGQLGYNIHVDKALLHENDNTIKVSVDAKDAAGNTVTVHEEHHVLVDTQLRAEITLDTVAGNNVINAKEVDHVSVTGTVGRDTDAQLGDHVTVTINHQSFTGVVSVINGHLGYDIPVDKGYLQDGKNTFDVSINATDKAGNAITVHDSHDVLVDTHADAKITINNVTDDNRIDSQEARHHVTHITGQIDSADVHNNEHINVTVNDKHYDVVLHEDNGHLTYDLPVNTHELNVGKNHVDVSVIANDDHGNTNVIHQKADFTMDDPAHRGKHDVDTGGREHHGAHGHDNGLSNLFGDSNDSLSFDLRPDSKGHHGDADPKVFTGKDDSQHEKIDLTSLAKELHENPDITHYIKGGDEHGHGKGPASAATHTPGVSHPGDATAMHDSGGSSHYSVDHLIAKPEHYSH